MGHRIEIENTKEVFHVRCTAYGCESASSFSIVSNKESISNQLSQLKIAYLALAPNLRQKIMN